MTSTAASSTEVTVVDIQMPFGSMVVFILKWTLAAIPAMIILGIIAAIFITIFGGILGGIFTSVA
jgi:hypothetical protein